MSGKKILVEDLKKVKPKGNDMVKSLKEKIKTIEQDKAINK